MANKWCHVNQNKNTITNIKLKNILNISFACRPPKEFVVPFGLIGKNYMIYLLINIILVNLHYHFFVKIYSGYELKNIQAYDLEE